MTSDELKDYADEHLFYEAQMFVWSRDEFAAPLCARQALRNARIEICVLHLRNLILFFYPQPSQKRDDISASLYDADWDARRPGEAALLAAARERANKELAHLTTARKAGDSDPAKVWDFARASAELRAVIEVFLSRPCPSVSHKVIGMLRRI